MKAIPATYNRAHHAFAVFTACAAFVVITAGALVTSNDAGLSVPDWPTSFGYLVKAPHFVGGVRYEWSHRMVAGTLVTLTLAIGIWTLLVERRRWLFANEAENQGKSAKLMMERLAQRQAAEEQAPRA